MRNENYDCAVIMERLVSPLDYAVHLAFNGVLHSSSMNKITYAGANPRGYFYDPVHVEDIIKHGSSKGVKSLEDITYRIGILDGISIFGARKSL